MRLWSIHPKYLDARGLVALWREALLAQKVLAGNTKGYKNHPQLERFKGCKDPLSSIGFYLYRIWKESKDRGYDFDKGKIVKICHRIKPVNIADGQIQFEFNHLKRKLRERAPDDYKRALKFKVIEPHPLFVIVDGPKASWER
jgi:hypothetical protein